MDIAILLGLIVLSAVISTAEIGFFAVNETKLRALAQNHNHRAKMALHLRSDPQKLLATILEPSTRIARVIQKKFNPDADSKKDEAPAEEAAAAPAAEAAAEPAAEA